MLAIHLFTLQYLKTRQVASPLPRPVSQLECPEKIYLRIVLCFLEISILTIHIGIFSGIETALEVEPSATAVAAAASCELTHRSDPEASIRRLLLMSYFPSGFWSRLMTRILADDAVVDIVRSFFIMPKEVTTDARLAQMLDVRADWVLWQTGVLFVE